MTKGRQHLPQCSARFAEATRVYVAYLLADSALGDNRSHRTRPSVDWQFANRFGLVQLKSNE